MIGHSWDWVKKWKIWEILLKFYFDCDMICEEPDFDQDWEGRQYIFCQVIFWNNWLIFSIFLVSSWNKLLKFLMKINSIFILLIFHKCIFSVYWRVISDVKLFEVSRFISIWSQTPHSSKLNERRWVSVFYYTLYIFLALFLIPFIKDICLWFKLEIFKW